MITGPVRGLIVGAVLLLVLSLAMPAVAAAADSDGDGLRDAFETRHALTSPTNPDSDGDGVVDSAEDSDGDGLGNLGEQRFGTDPSDPDSDSDGIRDSDEDSDGDGRSDGREQDQRPLPAGLHPAPRAAEFDEHPAKAECMTLNGRSKVVMCEYGDPEGEVEVVLAGDSHAMMYLTPLAGIAEQRGWKLTTMTKRACPAMLGVWGDNQWEIDKGRTCGLWQQRVVSRLNLARPDLVVLAHTPGYKLRKQNGKVVAPWKRSGQWRLGLKRVAAALPKETTVLALGGTPRNYSGNPVKCLQQNPGDISKCVTKRQPERARTMDVGLQQAASATRAQYDSLYEQVCSYDPCPVIQGDVLMWRDTSHLSETFANQLQPSIERMLLDALGLDPQEP